MPAIRGKSAGREMLVEERSEQVTVFALSDDEFVTSKVSS